MPIGFHRHHDGDSKVTSNPSCANRYVCGGNAVGHSTATRLTSGAATAVAMQAPGSRSSGVSADQLQRFDVMLRRPENRECFDCGAKQPRWASTNLGIFFCLRCAGIHRSMGTHISKVKSTNMDSWEEPMIQVMEHVGNARGRLLYEYNMPASARVTSSTDTSLVERALRAKYEKKTYYNPRFAELYAQLMATPIEGGSSSSALQACDKASITLAQINAPPRRAPPGQLVPQVPLDELWGAPVPSPVAGQTGPASAGGAGNNNNQNSVTSVAELFSDSCPAGVGAGPQQNMVWGSNPRPAGSSNSPAGNGTALSYTSPNSATTSGWFDSNFGGSNGNPLTGGTPPPATPHSPYTTVASASRSNTDDLFQGSSGASTSGLNASTKNEILSLFVSAPVAGAGGQTSSGHSSPNSGHPMAWQPQTVKPYYYPE